MIETEILTSVYYLKEISHHDMMKTIDCSWVRYNDLSGDTIKALKL
uniref:Uncharacterized protein n=1 Tax=Rhizophora mucronata TaxID=61149 RepID=A0A2P2MYV3_RHIMU